MKRGRQRTEFPVLNLAGPHRTIIESGRTLVCDCDPNDHARDGADAVAVEAATARRLVACWNALRQLTTEEVEAIIIEARTSFIPILNLPERT